jgi:3',5'-cyclic AMP phosphodiesterase CpdA
MRRRTFLKLAGASLVGVGAAGRGRAAAAEPELAVHQLASDRFELRFAPAEARPLRLLQITDTHFGNPESDFHAKDQRSFDLIRRLVDQQRIDFVVHTGDFINNDRGDSVRWDAVDFMNDLPVPWTHTLGNHDIGALPTEAYRARQRNAAFGYFDADGQREYAFRLDVVTPDTSRCATTLYCFDSGHAVGNKHVNAAQLEWFAAQREADRANGTDSLALVMVHIPMIEFESLRAEGDFRGIFGEGVCFESDQGKTFQTLKQSPRVKAVFSGHDHLNDYAGTFDGLELVYGRVTGWSGYGHLLRGARLIEIDPRAQHYRHKIVFSAES